MNKIEARLWVLITLIALGALAWLHLDTRSEIEKIKSEAYAIGFNVEDMSVRCR